MPSVHVPRHLAYRFIMLNAEHLINGLHGNSCLSHVACECNTKVQQAKAAGVTQLPCAGFELDEQHASLPRGNLVAWPNRPKGQAILLQSLRYSVGNGYHAGMLALDLDRFFSTGSIYDVMPSEGKKLSPRQSRSINQSKRSIVGQDRGIRTLERRERDALLRRWSELLAHSSSRLDHSGPSSTPVEADWPPRAGRPRRKTRNCTYVQFRTGSDAGTPEDQQMTQ